MQLTNVTDVFGVVIGERGLTRNLPDALWSYMPAWRSSTTNGTHNCLSAHRAAWGRVLTLSLKSQRDLPFLICEDDAIFRPSIDWAPIKAELDWYDLVYLGGQWTDPNAKRVTPITRIRSRQTCRSHAYMLTAAAADFLLAFKWNYPSPWTMQGWVDEMRVGICSPPIAGQAENLSLITGMMHVERWWDTND